MNNGYINNGPRKTRRTLGFPLIRTFQFFRVTPQTQRCPTFQSFRGNPTPPQSPTLCMQNSKISGFSDFFGFQFPGCPPSAEKVVVRICHKAMYLVRGSGCKSTQTFVVKLLVSLHLAEESPLKSAHRMRHSFAGLFIPNTPDKLNLGKFPFSFSCRGAL